MISQFAEISTPLKVETAFHLLWHRILHSNFSLILSILASLAWISNLFGIGLFKPCTGVDDLVLVLVATMLEESILRIDSYELWLCLLWKSEFHSPCTNYLHHTNLRLAHLRLRYSLFAYKSQSVWIEALLAEINPV